MRGREPQAQVSPQGEQGAPGDEGGGASANSAVAPSTDSIDAADEEGVQSGGSAETTGQTEDVYSILCELGLDAFEPQEGKTMPQYPRTYSSTMPSSRA